MRSTATVMPHTRPPTSTPTTFPGSAATLLGHLAAFGSAVETKLIENGNRIESRSLSEKRARNDRISKTINDDQKWSTYIKVYHNSGLRGKELQDQVPLVNVTSASSDRNECKSLSFEATKALEPDPQLLCLSCRICKRDASENSNKNFHSQVLFDVRQMNWTKWFLSSCWILAELKSLGTLCSVCRHMCTSFHFNKLLYLRHWIVEPKTSQTTK